MKEAGLLAFLELMDRTGMEDIHWRPQGIQYDVDCLSRWAENAIPYAYSTAPAGSVPLKDPHLEGRFYYWSTGG